VVGDRPQIEAGGELALADVRRPLDVGEKGTGAAHLQRVIDLRRRVAIVQRRRDQACLEAGEVVHGEIDAVRHQRGDAITRFEAQSSVAARERGARPVEFTPAERSVRRRDRRLVRGGIQPDPQEVLQWRGGSIELVALEQHGRDRTQGEEDQ
jgi:hypothetical protein